MMNSGVETDIDRLAKRNATVQHLRKTGTRGVITDKEYNTAYKSVNPRKRFGQGAIDFARNLLGRRTK